MSIVGKSAFLTATLGLAIVPCLQAQDIRIRVLNGHDGRPVSDVHAHLNYWSKDKPGLNVINNVADKDGYIAASLPNETDSIQAMFTYDDRNPTIAYVDCQQEQIAGTSPAHPVSEITKSGIVGENRCGRITKKAEPGVLILFIRPMNWWERLKARLDL